MTIAEFARLRGVAPRQIRRWLAAGLPMTDGTPAKVRVAASMKWIADQYTGRARSAREIAEVLTHRAAELLQRLRRLVHAHLPADVVAQRWAAETGTVTMALRAWPAVATPGLAARLRGEVTAPLEDPRFTSASVALRPASLIALAIATEAAARVCLEAFADTPIAMDPQIERSIASARQRVLSELEAVAHPRARQAAIRARIEGFRRDIRQGQWERVNVVEARWAQAAIAARQTLLAAAPRALIELSQSAGEPTIAAEVSAALAVAVETSLYELHRGARGPVADAGEV